MGFFEQIFLHKHTVNSSSWNHQHGGVFWAYHGTLPSSVTPMIAGETKRVWSDGGKVSFVFCLGFELWHIPRSLSVRHTAGIRCNFRVRSRFSHSCHLFGRVCFRTLWEIHFFFTNMSQPPAKAAKTKPHISLIITTALAPSWQISPASWIF
jgi:hypothetical protein